MPLTFNYPYHSFETKYPESSVKLQFGRGYEFVAKPKGPDQVVYVLHFTAMKFFVTAGVVNRTVNPTLNIAHLEDFYKTHRLYEKFIYPHPSDGNVNVRFKSPLTFKLKPFGLGTVEPFTVELLTQP
jgi:hypothetical protein